MYVLLWISFFTVVLVCFQIYTDWANHYLEKSRQKRYITDLQVDICDGVLLADVINAVSKYNKTHYPLFIYLFIFLFIYL